MYISTLKSKKISVCAIALLALFSQCNQTGTNTNSSHTDTSATKTTTTVTSDVKPVNTTYHLLTNKDSIKNIKTAYTTPQFNIILNANRTDSANISKIDTLIIPDNLSGNPLQYSVFPQTVQALGGVKKIIFFSYLDEYFGAYENGKLVRSGPTNMGRKTDQTPTGTYSTNWKAEKTTSTFNDEWELKWNFNVLNKEGIGFHQYALPGYPASHSCMRLQADDAMYLYSWADEWKVKGTENVVAKGTPVVIFGAYPFGSPKPWLQLVQNPHALDLTEAAIKQLVDTSMTSIMAAQSKTDSVRNIKM